MVLVTSDQMVRDGLIGMIKVESPKMKVDYL